MYGYFDTGMYGATPQMQERLAMMQRQQTMMNPQMPMNQPQTMPMQSQQIVPPLQGRQVMSIDEVKAIQVPLDGTVMYFPSPNEGKIYAKSVDLSGNLVLQAYELSNKPIQNPISTLESRVAQLENKLQAMRGEGNHEPITDYPNDATVPKSNGNVARNGRAKPSNG